MNCLWEDVPNSTDERGWRRVVCIRTGCERGPGGPRQLKPTPHPHDRIYATCSGTPLPHEYREWLALFSAAAGITQALAICQFIRWRAKGSKLEELPPGVPRPMIVPPPAPTEGPGTELKKILDSLGAKRTGGCGCEAMIEKMNRWGVECKVHRAEIVDHLREAYERLDFSSAAQAMTAGILAAWSLRLNPLDPLGSLVDEAIRRAEKTGAGTLGS